MATKSGKRSSSGAATDKTSNTLLTGSYDFCVAKASLGYALNKGTGTADSKNSIAGVLVPFRARKVLAPYICHNDKTAANKDANQWAIG